MAIMAAEKSAESYNSKDSNNSNGSNASKDNEESGDIRMSFPTEVPIIFESLSNDADLPALNKRKFLVAHHASMSQFISFIRSRMRIRRKKALFFFINSSMVCLNKTVAELYAEHHNEDDFLCIQYGSENDSGEDDEDASRVPNTSSSNSISEYRFTPVARSRSISEVERIKKQFELR